VKAVVFLRGMVLLLELDFVEDGACFLFEMSPKALRFTPVPDFPGVVVETEEDFVEGTMVFSFETNCRAVDEDEGCVDDSIGARCESIELLLLRRIINRGDP
jgi:hypothetical protein